MREILSMENHDEGAGKFELSEHSDERGSIKGKVKEMAAKHQREVKQLHIKYESQIVDLQCRLTKVEEERGSCEECKILSAEVKKLKR